MLSATSISDKIDKHLLHELYTISIDAAADCYITIPAINAWRIVRKLIIQNRQMLSKDIPREVSPIFLDSIRHDSLFKQPIHYHKCISCLNRINLNIIEIMEEYENENENKTTRPYWLDDIIKEEKR